MDITNYFDLSIANQSLFGAQKQVIRGGHGITKNEKGEHYATAYHIYTNRSGLVLAKPELKKFLLEKFPGNSDLTNSFKNENIIENEVEYIGDGYSIKKIKLEWIVELYERENNIRPVSSPEILISNNSDEESIKRHILPLFDTIGQFDVFINDDDSNKKIFNDIFELIKKNPDKYEVLSLVYYPVVFEKVCSYFMKNSSRFHSVISTETDWKIKKFKKVYPNREYIYKFSDYIEALKNHSNSSSKEEITKKFSDIDYFRIKRNDFIHNEYKPISFLQIMSNSERLLNLIIEIIEDYTD